MQRHPQYITDSSIHTLVFGRLLERGADQTRHCKSWRLPGIPRAQGEKGTAGLSPRSAGHAWPERAMPTPRAWLCRGWHACDGQPRGHGKGCRSQSRVSCRRTQTALHSAGRPLFVLHHGQKDSNLIFPFSSECFPRNRLVQPTACNWTFSGLWKSTLLPTKLLLREAIMQRTKRNEVLVKILSTTHPHYYCF